MSFGTRAAEAAGLPGRLMKNLTGSEAFGVSSHAQMTATLVDPGHQWSQAKNIWHNAAIRSAVYATASPLRWLRGLAVRGN